MKLTKIVKMSQKKLFNAIASQFGKKALVRNGCWILVRGEAPVMLVAHMDTVHKETVKDLCIDVKQGTLMSPQGIGGDDRCGVYGLLKVYDESPVKPWLLFTCDEEIGCVGARAFVKEYSGSQAPEFDGLDTLKFIVEIDRQGSNDAVFYECENDDFEEFITSYGFVTQFGSFSDISEIAPAIGAAAVNLSSGYYCAHTTSEYIRMGELERTIERVKEMVSAACKDETPRYEYIEYEYKYDRFFDDKFYAKNSWTQDWDFGGTTLDTTEYNELTEVEQDMYQELVNKIGEYETYMLLKDEGVPGLEEAYDVLIAEEWEEEEEQEEKEVVQKRRDNIYSMPKRREKAYVDGEWIEVPFS